MSAGQPPLHWETTLPDGRRASLLLRDSVINLLLDGEQPSFTFDLLGRLHGAFYEGRNYRRSLDNRVLAKWSASLEGRQQRQRRWLELQEAQTLVQRVHDLAAQVAATTASAPQAVQEAAASLARWDWASLEADRARFQQIYTPVGILPPDQYLALVLQATHGCSHNACTFCTFYQDIPFRIKTPEQFRQHLADVVDFFGPAMAMRKSIFLADANALVAPMPRLRELLRVVEGGGGEGRQVDKGGGGEGRQVDKGGGGEGRQVDKGRRGQVDADGETYRSSVIGHRASLPVFAFIDAFHVERKSLADWQELRAMGLARVYIGMESGHDPLLRWLNKPGDAAAVLDAVTTLKGAGLQASVILLLGAGGDRYAAGHVRDSSALLNAMPLARGDLIYFSDFVAQANAPYAALAAAAGIEALPAAALRAQEAAIRAGYAPRDAQQSPQFARYDIGEFVY
jgi:hypothetical protein